MPQVKLNSSPVIEAPSQIWQRAFHFYGVVTFVTLADQSPPPRLLSIFIDPQALFLSFADGEQPRL